MVHAEAADAIVSGGRGADFAVVDSGGRAAGTVLVDDCKVSGVAGAAGVGRGFGGVGAAVHRCGVSRLSPGAWESAQSGEHRIADRGADDDRSGLGGHVLNPDSRSHLKNKQPKMKRPAGTGVRRVALNASSSRHKL